MPFTKYLAANAVVLWSVAFGLQADVTLTQLANEGVLLDDGATRVMIDGMVVERYSLYGGLPQAAAAAFERAEDPFHQVDLALASHRHHDHNQPLYACRFMQASTQTVLYSSPQVLGLMREKCRQFITTSPRVNEINPPYEAPYTIHQGSAAVTVFRLSHGTRKYARIQNFGHLVEMGGLKILHIGDAAMTAEDFARAGLDRETLDVVLIPYWFFQPGPGAEVVEKYLNATHQFAVHIPPGEMEEVLEYMEQSYPTVKILPNPLDRMTIRDTSP
jgi:L-ascorbate metabolism protein UlaG (beta-lactamase superfamily)